MLRSTLAMRVTVLRHLRVRLAVMEHKSLADDAAQSLALSRWLFNYVAEIPLLLQHFVHLIAALYQSCFAILCYLEACTYKLLLGVISILMEDMF